MNVERLLQHYERIADAPDAIERLRRFILDLAVLGKLVPQDPNNEPIAGRYLPELGGDDIPASWRVLNFGKFCDIEGGNQPPKSQFADEPRDGYIRLLQIRDLGDKPVPVYIPITAARRVCKEGEILIGRYGASVGKVFWAQDGAYNVAMAKFIWPEDALIAKFAFLLLKSEFLQGPLAAATRSAQAGFNKGDLAPINFPLPPLAEQHRIVAKVDELMALCDRLDAARNTREATRDRLAAASLARLNAPDPETFQVDARFALDTLRALTTRPDQIKQLRQTILNLAVRGKLEPQDPDDEPASELLKRIEEERRQLVEARRRLRSRDAPAAGEALPPFDLPNGWQWARFAEVAAIQSNLVDPRDYQTYPHIAPDNIESGTGRLLAYETIANSGVFSAKHLFEPGCLLYSKIRPALAKVTPVDFRGLCSADMYPVWPFINRRYLQQFMLTEVFVRQSVSEDNRVAMPKINQEALSKILVAVPPLAEQHRIVAKVDALMALCYKLEASLADAAGTRLRLLDALLAESLAPVQALAMEAAE